MTVLDRRGFKSWRSSDTVIIAFASVAVTVAAVVISVYPAAGLATITIAVVAGAIGVACKSFELFTLLMIAGRTAVEISHGNNQMGLLRLSALLTGAYTLMAAIWLVSRRAHGRLRISAISVWVAIFTMASLISALASQDRAQALTGASRWLFLTVFVLVLENVIVDERSVRRLLIAVGASTLVPIGMGLWQFLTRSPDAVDGLVRVEGSFSHPNTYGFYLAVIGLMLTALLPTLRSWPRIFTGLLLFGVSVSLLATYSRTSYVAFIAGLAVLAIVGRRTALIGIAAIAIGAALLFPGVGDRLADVGEASTIRGTAGDSLSWRLDYWQEVIEVGDGSRVTGLGLGLVGDLTDEGREPHNDFVRAYVEVGIVGLVAYLGLLIVIGRRIARSLQMTRRLPGPAGRSRAMVEGFAAIFAAYLAASFTGNLMTQLILLWYVLAIGVAATVIHERGRRIVISRPEPVSGRS